MIFFFQLLPSCLDGGVMLIAPDKGEPILVPMEAVPRPSSHGAVETADTLLIMEAAKPTLYDSTARLAAANGDR